MVTTTVVSLDIAAENVFTNPISVNSDNRVSVSVAGEFDATVVVQRMLDGQNWRSVPNEDATVGWTGPTEQTYQGDETCLLRIGVPTGMYNSGTISVRLGKN